MTAVPVLAAEEPDPRCGRDPHPGDAAGVELGDGQGVAVEDGSLPDSRHVSEPLQDLPGDGLVGLVRQRSVSSSKSSRLRNPSTSRSPVSERVVSGSWTRSSSVMMPAVPPYSSTTIATCAPSRRMSVSADSICRVEGSINTSRAISLTRTERLDSASDVRAAHRPRHPSAGPAFRRRGARPLAPCRTRKRLRPTPSGASTANDQPLPLSQPSARLARNAAASAREYGTGRAGRDRLFGLRASRRTRPWRHDSGGEAAPRLGLHGPGPAHDAVAGDRGKRRLAAGRVEDGFHLRG